MVDVKYRIFCMEKEEEIFLNNKLRSDKTVTENRRDYNNCMVTRTGRECKISVIQDLGSLVTSITKHTHTYTHTYESRLEETVGINRDCNEDHARNVTILYRRRHRLSAPTCIFL